MSPTIFFAILFLTLATSNAFPGQSFIKSLFLYCGEFCFKQNPYGGAQNVLLDEFYVSYFNAETEQIRQTFMSKIAIYTHIYMLRWKLDQNIEQLQHEVLTKENKYISFYKRHSDNLSRIITLFAEMNLYDEALCLLLRIKFETLKALQCENKFDKEIFQNNCIDEAKLIISENLEHIKEWMLSDLLQFIDHRHKLLKYFDISWFFGLVGVSWLHNISWLRCFVGAPYSKISKSNIRELNKVRESFIMLVGGSRVALLCGNIKELSFFCSAPFSSYALMYSDYFQNKSEIGKWRSKMMLEFSLYNKWGSKFFQEEYFKIRSEADECKYLTNCMQLQTNFLTHMFNCWVAYSKIFWYNEKKIREKIADILKKSRAKLNVLKEMIKKAEENAPASQYAVGTDKVMLLWENGPADTSLYYALRICIEQAVAEHSKKVAERRPRDLNDLETEITAKFFICIGNKMGKAPRKDPILGELQFNEMAKLLNEWDDFRQILEENKNLWRELMDNDRAKKFEVLLKEQPKYFPVAESFVGLAASDTDEETFEDTNDKFIVEKNEIKTNQNDYSVQNISKIEEILANFDIKNGKKAKNSDEIIELTDEYELYHKKIREMYGNSEINDELLELYSESENWIKQSQSKKAKTKEKMENRRKDIKKYKNQNENGDQSMKSKKLKAIIISDNNKTSAEKTEKKKESLEIYIKKYENEEISKKNCTKTLKEIGIVKLADLLDNFLLKNIFKNLFLNNLEEIYVEHLNNIFLLVRAIQAKLNFIKIRSTIQTNKNFKKFDKKWDKFINFEKNKLEEIQFLRHKLYFMHNELEQLAFDPSKNSLLEKAVEIMDENKFMKIENDFSNKKNENNYEVTQFGSYNIVEFNTVLTQLKVHEYSTFIAKGIFDFETMESLKMTKCQNERKYSNDESLTCESRTKNLYACAEYDDKYVKMLENMLKMKILDSLFNVYHAHDLEGSQYNLIRTIPKNREIELQISDEISNFISSPEFGRKNKTPILALKKDIESIVEDWAKQFTSIKPRLVTIGSHLMSADMEGSDLDLLCVVHDKINVAHFYGESGGDLFTLLKKKLKGINYISWIDGKVKMVRIEHVNIEVDLSLVPVPEEYLSRTKLLLEDDELIRQMTYESGIYSLAGYKSAKFQLSLLSSGQKEECISLLKAVKVWAKIRLIYSGIFGYFNGAALSVMATKICALFPNAPLSYLLLQFFSIYSNWDWANRAPVILDKLTPITMNQIVRFWSPIFSLALMNVITPKFPEQNAAFNVNDFTFRTIIAELKIANQILSENVKKWQHIFEEIKFKEHFGHFALILCSAINFEEYSKNCAFQKSKIREKLLAWANQESVAQRLEQFHLIPQSEEKIACRMRKTTAFGRLWLVGLTMKAEYRNENLTLNLLPIYDSDQLPALDVFWIRSLYAEAKNLKKRIEILRHIKQ